MPRRTNPFQDLVTLIELQLAPAGATIYPCALIGDPAREIDILVRVPAGHHHVLVGVECIDRRRPASVEWVEQILAKHRSLAIHKSVLVSRTGFSKEASKMAQRAGAETLTLKNAMAKDWKPMAHSAGGLHLLLVVRERIEAVWVEFNCEEYPFHINFEEALYYRNGEPIEPLREIAFKVQQHPNVDRELYLAARETGEGLARLVWVFEEGEYLMDEHGKRYPMIMLVEILKGRIEQHPVNGSRAAYSDKEVLFGSVELEEGKIQTVAVEHLSGEISVASQTRGPLAPLGHSVAGVDSLVPPWTHKHDLQFRRVCEEFEARDKNKPNRADRQTGPSPP